MSQSLDGIIRALADKGELTHLSVISSGGGWHASFSPAATWGNGHGFDQDPVAAIHKAIEAAPKTKAHTRGLKAHIQERVSPINLTDMWK